MQHLFRHWYRVLIGISLMLAFVLLEGCYYMQAIGGQLEVLRKRRPLTEVIADDATSEALRERLAMVQEARQFAIEQLLLPENGSYSSYTDLQRDYVVWNVFAAPEFSLVPKRWCFPVAGCVAYRGYFAEGNARKKASKLGADGFDVYVGGVAAYSTLGRFDDPILNTMMRWSDLYLVETLFHELAHQKLYVSGDTAFNESFASAVAEFGIERWVEAQKVTEQFATSRREAALEEEVRLLMMATRQNLEDLYASDQQTPVLRREKTVLMDRLSQDVQLAIDVSGVQTKNWLAAPLNNARLVSLGVYAGHLSAFRAMLRNCDNDLECFYAAAAGLADLDIEQRQSRLASLEAA